MPAIAPLQHNWQLDRAAAAWAAGGSAATAAGRSGYQARVTVGLRSSGPDDSILQSLRRSRCRMLADQSLRDVGVYRRGPQTWLVIAAPRADSVATSLSNPAPTWRTLTPARQPDADEAPARTYSYATAPSLARTGAPGARVLQLVNEVRATGSTLWREVIRTRASAATFGDAGWRGCAACLGHGPATTTSNMWTCRATALPTGCAPPATGSNWSVRTSPMAQPPPMRSWRGGCTAPGTARTSWIPDSGRNGSGPGTRPGRAPRPVLGPGACRAREVAAVRASISGALRRRPASHARAAADRLNSALRRPR